MTQAECEAPHLFSLAAVLRPLVRSVSLLARAIIGLTDGTILSFVATIDDSYLISWTVACLLLALFVLATFAGTTGETVHVCALTFYPFFLILIAYYRIGLH